MMLDKTVRRPYCSIKIKYLLIYQIVGIVLDLVRLTHRRLVLLLAPHNVKKQRDMIVQASILDMTRLFMERSGPGGDVRVRGRNAIVHLSKN
jgi:hypothetical protein